MILVGILGILLGRLPSLAAGLPLTLQSSYDRFMVSMMIGGSLLLLGMIELLVKNNQSQKLHLCTDHRPWHRTAILQRQYLPP